MSVDLPHQVRFYITHNRVNAFIQDDVGASRLKLLMDLIRELITRFPVRKIGLGMYSEVSPPELNLIVLMDKGVTGVLTKKEDPELWDSVKAELETLYGEDSPMINHLLPEKFAAKYYSKILQEQILPKLMDKYNVTDAEWLNIVVVFDKEKFEGVPYVDWVEVYDESVGLLNGGGIPYDVFEILMFKEEKVKLPRSEGILTLSFFRNLLHTLRAYNMDYQVETGDGTHIQSEFHVFRLTH
jgi:hypothetical protein